MRTGAEPSDGLTFVAAEVTIHGAVDLQRLEAAGLYSAVEPHVILRSSGAGRGGVANWMTVDNQTSSHGRCKKAFGTAPRGEEAPNHLKRSRSRIRRVWRYQSVGSKRGSFFGGTRAWDRVSPGPEWGPCLHGGSVLTYVGRPAMDRANRTVLGRLARCFRGLSNTSEAKCHSSQGTGGCVAHPWLDASKLGGGWTPTYQTTNVSQVLSPDPRKG